MVILKITFSLNDTTFKIKFKSDLLYVNELLEWVHDYSYKMSQKVFHQIN
jgi:hypothetical protein